MTTAFFSILEPGNIYRITGASTKGLFAIISAYWCRSRVKNAVFGLITRSHTEEGKCLMFDDTYDHEVWNDTDGLRAVLFMDIIRPMSFPASTINNAIISTIKQTGYIQDARKNQKAREEKFGKAVAD